MIGLDTHVIVRFLVKDDEEQHAPTVRLLRRAAEEGEALFVGDVVLAEVVWVLQARYGLRREEIANTVRALLEAGHLAFESTDRCLRALRRFEGGRGGFADYLIAERASDEGCLGLATFDQALLLEEGMTAP